MSLFDLGEQYRDRVTTPVTLTPADETTLSALLGRPRHIPCRRCSRHVIVVATGDPARPAMALCEPCQQPPTECTCERVSYVPERIPYHA